MSFSIHHENPFRSLKDLQPGDFVQLGTYRVPTGVKPLEPDSLTQPIQWRILERRGDRLMLLSELVLDWELFDFGLNKWKQSFLREALNGEYLEEWFSPDEQALLCGEPDRVYLLTVEKARKYFPQPGSAAACMLECDGCDASTIERCPQEWWLCTPGSEPGLTAYVTHKGEISEEGFASDADEFGVRPVIWIDLARLGQPPEGEE